MSSEKEPAGKIKYKPVDRSQISLRVLDYEHLIEADHAARIIWELAGKMNLKPFEKDRKTREGEAGRACWPPRLLVSIWVYAYSQRVASARAIGRMVAYEPGLRWLTADQEVNYHTLADFRVSEREALEKLFAEFLALLDQAGVVNLKTILQDGTKLKSVAGKSSFHRRSTLEKRLKAARNVVRKLDQEAAREETMDKRRQAAQQRAARTAVERGEAALAQLEKREAAAGTKRRAEVRVSHSEPEARKMKDGHGGFQPGYNLQVSTEARSRLIVAVGVTNEQNDLRQLIPALDRLEQNGLQPQTVIADNGYATRDNVERMAERDVEFISPWKDDAVRQVGPCARNGIAKEFTAAAFQRQARGQELLCPEGKSLVVIQQKKHHGMNKVMFEAKAEDCAACRFRKQCCGRRGGPRRVELPCAAMGDEFVKTTYV